MLGGGAGSEREIEVEIERIRARMAAIEAERVELEAVLSDLVSQRSAMAQVNHQPNIARCADRHGRVLQHRQGRAVSAPVRRPP